jgi:toxin ParE1/3/4
MNVEFHPAALRDVEQAQGWYEERSAFAASAFLRELSTAVRRVREAPQRYPSADAGTRRIGLERFPFTLYFRVHVETVTVIAVAHQKRRPEYWTDR